jgi:hypothetical protein
MKIKDIYKFRAMSVNSLTSLASNKIWFSSQKNLNDPFEGIVNIIEPPTNGEMIKKSLKFGFKAVQKQFNLSESQANNIVMSRYLNNPQDVLDFVNEGIGKFKNELSEYQDKLGIFSTASDIPNDPRTQVGNMLLWSHYADEFKGFCVQYDIDILQGSLRENNSESEFAWTKVDYVDLPHSIDILEDSELSAKKYLSSVQRKHEQWDYECEVRLISTTTGLKSFSPEAVKAIYIGERMPKEQEYLLRGVIEHNLPDTEIFKVTTDRQSYSIVIKKI